MSTKPKDLKVRHYPLKGNKIDFFFNAWPRNIYRYRAKFGDNFCLILHHGNLDADAYVIPFSVIKELFVESNLVPWKNSTMRWLGSIRNGRLHLRTASGDKSVQISKYYNAFTLLNSESKSKESPHTNSYSASFIYPEEVLEPEKYVEGARQNVVVNSYERNPVARQKCIEHYGTSCTICGFEFESMYGEIGKGFIHVHHLRQLSELSSEYDVDPIKDLRPVCPNCHAMIHRNKTMLTTEQVKSILKKR